jgi:O-antigen ligase
MSEGNSYWGAWRGGIQQALIDPIKGTGPSSTRKICKTLEPSSPDWLPGKNYCGNHPHNYYIQLLAETGIIGLIIGCIMFISIIITCYKARKKILIAQWLPQLLLYHLDYISHCNNLEVFMVNGATCFLGLQ